jgi:predicted enzyme related to lactoylglutathione lyase
VYITVTDLDARVAQVVALGGRVLRAPNAAGPSGRFAVITDPAGAACALFEPAAPPAS